MDFRKLKGVGEIACVNGGPDYYKIPLLTNASIKRSTQRK